MPAPPPRPWFRFSLRMLFVLVTVLCCWLGWESRIVRQRKAVLQELKSKPAFQLTTAKVFAEHVKTYPPGLARPSIARVSLVRQLLGDEAIQQIIYLRWYQGYSDEDLARIQKAFPEAVATESLPPPCHPGCFPRGTLVATPDGLRAIETLSEGELVTAFDKSGQKLAATIQSVFRTENYLWEVETERGSLTTTETQPLCLAIFEVQTAGKLVVGQELLVREVDELRSVSVVGVHRTGHYEPVFNLVVGDTVFFVANGYLVRSKPPAALAAQ